MRVTAQTEDYTTASSGPLVVQIWHANTVVEGVDHLFAALAAQADAHGKAYCLNVVASSRAPAPAARVAIAQSMVRQRDQIAACALVFEGSGFGAATIRAVVAGLNMASNHPFPYKVFAEIPVAMEWFSGLSNGPRGLSVGAAIEDIASIRRVHLARYQLAG